MPPGSTTGGTANGCSQSPVTGIENGYTCPTVGWNANLVANQTSTDATATLNSTAGISQAGCFFVDHEYECYTGISGSTLTGISRGAYTTLAAAHGVNAGLTSVDLALGPPNEIPPAEIIGGGDSTPILGVNNPFPASHAGDSVMAINQGGNETWFNQQGGMYQTNQNAGNYFGSTQIGATNQPLIRLSGDLLQGSAPNTAYQPLTLGGGHAGSLNVIPTPTLGAPSVSNQGVTPGTSTISWVCAGTDFDGNLVNGTTTTITNGATSWSFPSSYYVQCPWTAGVNTYQIYRTVGGVNQGLIFSGVGPGAFTYDLDGSATAGTPPSVNGSNPHVSVTGTGTPGLQLGPTNISTGAGAPASVCGTAPIGSGSLWLRTDGGGSTSLYACSGSTWTAVVIP